MSPTRCCRRRTGSPRDGRRPTADSAAVLTTDGSFSVRDLLDRAAGAAAAIGTGGRVLSVVDLTLPDRVGTALLGALAADGSLIQVTHAAARRSRPAGRDRP